MRDFNMHILICCIYIHVYHVTEYVLLSFFSSLMQCTICAHINFPWTHQDTNVCKLVHKPTKCVKFMSKN